MDKAKISPSLAGVPLSRWQQDTASCLTEAIANLLRLAYPDDDTVMWKIDATAEMEQFGNESGWKQYRFTGRRTITISITR